MAMLPMQSWLKTKVLGCGAYGVVYLATSLDPRRVPGYGSRIAVKSALYHMSHTLQKERLILECFKCVPEILQCYGGSFTIENGFVVYNLLLELAPYGTLSDLINKKPTPEEKAKVYIYMLLKGLSSIHAKGVVHCDLKPDNVLVFPVSVFSPYHSTTASYQLKIGDFGLSRTPLEDFDVNDWKFRFRGTPNYMSPEAIADGIIETPLDIWSLGCIVIEMLTGSPALCDLETVEEIVYYIGIHKRAPEIPNELSWVCKDFLSKCLVTNPSERWTADMLLNHPFLLRV